MWTTHATALIGLLLVLAAWVAVQSAWRRAFPGAFRDPDVLAGRMGCGNCGCATVCERDLPERRAGGGDPCGRNGTERAIRPEEERR